MLKDTYVSIGFVAKRTGNAVSLIRYYANEGLIPSIRTSGGNRMFPRSVIRRVSFILIAQNLGYSLSQIQQLLATLPDSRTPTKADWTRLSKVFNVAINTQIQQLQKLQSSLDGCIGCGCLSLDKCRLYNRDDKINQLGAGPRFLLGDNPVDVT
jgi:MerR family redox-sensitive transcriptional activator SoxR